MSGVINRLKNQRNDRLLLENLEFKNIDLM